jgi:hypothetical protein
MIIFSAVRLLLFTRISRIIKHKIYREHKVGRDLRARRHYVPNVIMPYSFSKPVEGEFSMSRFLRTMGACLGNIIRSLDDHFS